MSKVESLVKRIQYLEAELARIKSKEVHRKFKSLRSGMSGILRTGKMGAFAKDAIGCDSQQLKAHIESQFSSGMTWHNYGRKHNQWSIDHIKPVVTFNLLDPAEQKMCFHYTNMRPMWAIENIKKNSFWDGRFFKK